jgi:hypothetical protein
MNFSPKWVLLLIIYGNYEFFSGCVQQAAAGLDWPTLWTCFLNRERLAHYVGYCLGTLAKKGGLDSPTPKY